MKVLIREITPKDAANFVKLRQKVYDQNSNLIFSPRISRIDPIQQAERIKRKLHAGNSTVFLAETNNQLVGFLIIMGSSMPIVKHRAEIVIGVLQEYRGKGIGTKLFEKLMLWTKKKELHRIELGVMVNNSSAVALYKKFGFKIEGVKRDAYIVDGEYRDGYFMSLLL